MNRTWLPHIRLIAATSALALVGAVSLTTPANALNSALIGTISARNAPQPVQKPVPPAPLVLSQKDADKLRSIMKSVKSAGWSRAASEIGHVENPLARKVVTWLRLQDAASGASFYEISKFVTENDTWPRIDRLVARAEVAMPDTLTPSEILGWFTVHSPQTGDGMLRLAEAHLREGRTSVAERWIKKAWREASLTRSAELQIDRRYSRFLDASDHEARLERMVWAGDRSGVRRMLRKVPASVRNLADARIKLRFSSRGVDRAIASVPSHLENHPGLLYERIRWRRKKDRDRETWPLLAEAPRSGEAMGNPERWWIERRIQTRHALSAGEYSAAYDFVAHHGMERGASFADAEWKAGWIALRYLRDPQAAFGHFKHLTENVSYPISRSRGLYWMGRAMEDARNTAEASTHYAEAARFPETYYGQLAMERLDAIAPTSDAIMRLPANVEPTLLEKQAFMRSELARAAAVASDFADDWVVRILVLHMADNARTQNDYALVADFARDLDFMHFSVRVAKKAAQDLQPIVNYGYPVVDLPKYQGRGKEPERALVLALMRQESEFNTSARSSARASGLMQLVSGTARSTARNHGLSYERSWLTTKPGYNSQLGRAHLADLLEEYDGSYILTLAAYNAGSHRVKQWLKEFGDPRRPGTDPIDWVERIPFGETRNYVQRILETVSVYRNLLTGRDHKIMLSEDLRRTEARLPRLHSVAPQLARVTPVIPLNAKDRENSFFGIISPAFADPKETRRIETPRAPAPDASRSEAVPMRPVRKPGSGKQASNGTRSNLTTRQTLASIEPDLLRASVPTPVLAPQDDESVPTPALYLR